MTITRKEKILIFVLILFILVGGGYALGVMNFNGDRDESLEAYSAYEGTDENINTDGSNGTLRQQMNDYSTAVYNRLQAQITQDLATLEALSNPSNNRYEEALPSNIPNQTDSLESVTLFMTNYLSRQGIEATGDTLNITGPTTSGGSIIYNLTCSYAAVSMSSVYDFIDETARVVSYNIMAITFNEAGDGTVTGTLSIRITLVNITSA